VPLLSFNSTEDNKAIEDFLQTYVNSYRLENLEEIDMLIIHGPNTALFVAGLAVGLAKGCQEIFYPRLKSERVPKDFSFFTNNYGLEVDGNSPDTVLTLGQKEEPLKIPLLLLEEKLPLESLDEAVPQLSKYAKKIFSQQISFDGKDFGFESAYILALSQKTRQVKLIHYTRPNEDQTLAQCVKYSCEFGLLKNGTRTLKMKYVRDLFRVLLNCVYLQLKSLDLID